MTDKKEFYSHISRDKSGKMIFVIDINSEILECEKNDLFDNC